ncbi:DUF4097 family beta strand repeat protein [Thermohalobacter berrensis]|uniref:Adhesin domain-containing protein n=1 Tax=Thermohalobacter berrensis TaxID=99594 RepID=A0A419T540_9FIRM|nr:DUF4097 family beta strand repeat protein [Thermohalobacter berrensis]RKD32562.1 hypothetical protein BET03_10830 [Thermohalobacter berrensis]
MDRKNKVGILSLAFTLIAIGVILLLDNFIDIDVIRSLSILWPIIIVLFGLELIIKYFMLKNGENGIKFHGLSILLLIIIIFITSAISNIYIYFPNLEIGEFINYNYRYNSEFSKDYEIDKKAKLSIDNTLGNIDIKKSKIENIKINTTVEMDHNDEEYAQKVANEIIEILELKNEIKIITKTRNYLDKRDKVANIRVNLSILVPKDLEIDVKNRHGNVIVEGIKGPVNVVNEHGEIKTKLIENNVNIINAHGDIKIENINGNVKVENEHGNIEVDKVSQDLIVKNQFGSIEINQVEGNANITNSHDKINVKNVKGKTEIDSKFSEVEVSNVGGDLDIKGEHRDIIISKAMENVMVFNKFGDIEVEGVNKNIKIKNNNGEITLSNNENIEGKVDIENEFGNIKLELSKNQGGYFKIFTDSGKVDTDLPFTIKKDFNEESVDDKIGNNKSEFYIHNERGDISIETID